ncbi:ribosomal protein S18-alanine N-acetyltransferase [uncultured Ruminobacter sp.]|uniref:ribosomal protein S18-alanine N-acetyltransferase n=1 Tax=uncultured Ruminobacter sp. TaxID=538947 RepID=UPI0025EB2E6F|nr:ribosomal protein S18-alanine N-acetyltransferase [uncultured Ruminobacter sp.]
MQIKKINKDELAVYLPQIISIERQVQDHPWSEKIFLDSVGDNYRFYVLVEDDTVLGYAVYDYVLDESTLQNISVAAENQGRGLGRHLLLESMRMLKDELGIVRMMLEVRISNIKAINLYKSVGFAQDMIRKNYYPMSDGSREHGMLMSMCQD